MVRIGVPYGSRTPTGRGRRREREATYCNSTELSGMDSTLPHLEDSRERLLDSRGLGISRDGRFAAIWRVMRWNRSGSDSR